MANDEAASGTGLEQDESGHGAKPNPVQGEGVPAKAAGKPKGKIRTADIVLGILALGLIVAAILLFFLVR